LDEKGLSRRLKDACVQKGEAKVNRKTVVKQEVATCPDCGLKVPLEGQIWLGREVTCPHCEAELEVVETVPVELDWLYEDDDEYDDEDKEEEDD
jgi:lysine biosynthesis protein LysW